MNKLHFRKPIIKPEDRRTICIVDECTDLRDEVADNCNFATALVATAASTVVPVMDGFAPNLKGIAVCAEDEEFNENVGCDVARTYAYKNYHVRMAKDYSKVIRLLEKAIAQLKPLMEKHEEQAAKLCTEIKKLQED